MVQKQDFKRITDYIWEIPASYNPNMQVPVRVFASERILEATLGDRSIQQAVNAASLPGLVSHVSVMPDVHQGYGFPIGGVAASHHKEGVISPGGIGYDINCGVRLLSSSISAEEAQPLFEDLANALNARIPSGVGKSGSVRLKKKDLERVCRDGAGWALKAGYADAQDLQRTEESGALSGADPGDVSPRALERGMPQLGTLGAGNHFIEVGLVEQIFHPDAAQAMGLVEGMLTVFVHSGSRGFGHQVCSDSVRDLQAAVRKYKINLPDRELVCAPLTSPEGRKYLSAMSCAANYAFANRQVLAFHARRAFEHIFAGKVQDWHLRQVYDIAHNIGKMETHQVAGESVRVCVHRKGATRAFGPGFEGLPPEYRRVGQPVLVPGSMGTASWVLVGTQKSMELSFGSSCHGAGRVMSRSKAKKKIRGHQLRDELQSKGIEIRAGSMAGLAEEAPAAYKDVDSVVDVVAKTGIAKKVARLRPLAVIKG
jgi:tRNA-splicing ligase RtcB